MKTFGAYQITETVSKYNTKTVLATRAARAGASSHEQESKSGERDGRLEPSR